MNNVFETKVIYGEKWQVVESRPFNAEELAFVGDECVIVNGEYGLSACWQVGGGKIYMDLSTEATCSVGDICKTADMKYVKLERNGETCDRVMYDK